MNAEQIQEYAAAHAPSLPVWVWAVLAVVTAANAAGVVFMLYLARRAFAAANKSDDSCRQAALYHDPPNLFAAVRRAEEAAAKAEGRAICADGDPDEKLEKVDAEALLERIIAAIEIMARVTTIGGGGGCCNCRCEEGESDPCRDAGLY